MCFTAFTFNLAFSIVLTSAYPYLIQVSLNLFPYYQITMLLRLLTVKKDAANDNEHSIGDITITIKLYDID